MEYHFPLSNFNPRSHERSDSSISNVSLTVLISIHAPTRGATDGNLQCQLINAISIHAPTRGATFKSVSKNDNQNISIHAPTRGATMSFETTHHMLINFNPRSHERSDVIYFLSSKNACISIHAPTRGATLSISLIGMAFDISIHAPTRGATQHKLRL